MSLECFSEKAMATHSSTLAWKIPWTEEPGRLQSMRSRSQTGLSDFTFTFHFSLSCIGEGNGNPLQYSCLENPRKEGAWWVAIHGVTQSRTRLKWLSSSSSSRMLLVVKKLWIQNSQKFLLLLLLFITVIEHFGKLLKWALWTVLYQSSCAEWNLLKHHN